MRIVEPEVHIIAESKIDETGLEDYLAAIGADQWITEAVSDAEYLTEVMGKSCYLSFSTDLNRNLTKVNTRDNQDYVKEAIVKNLHHSVLEHTSVSIAFVNVSRVLTHELVRHRIAAYSQVSGRYVRTDDLGFWIPSCIENDPELKSIFVAEIKHQEEVQRRMVEISGIESMTDFKKKKILTSAFRRLIGNGVSNHINATYNHRALRHMIELRTDASAEEEIRLVFNKLYDRLFYRFPSIYADGVRTLKDGHDEIKFDCHRTF